MIRGNLNCAVNAAVSFIARRLRTGGAPRFYDPVIKLEFVANKSGIYFASSDIHAEGHALGTGVDRQRCTIMETGLQKG